MFEIAAYNSIQIESTLTLMTNIYFDAYLKIAPFKRGFPFSEQRTNPTAPSRRP